MPDPSPLPEPGTVGLFRRRHGWKTYLGALGLLGLAIFQFSTGHPLMGFHSLFLAITAAGLRGAIADLQP